MNGEPLSKQFLNIKINNIFGRDKGFGVSMLRKIILTKNYSNFKDNIINSAYNMGTSYNEIFNSYIKK